MVTASTPRLNTLKPNEVAQYAYDLLTQQATLLAGELGVVSPHFGAPQNTMAGVRMVRLTKWAQTGEGMRDDEVSEALHKMLELLYSRAAVADARDQEVLLGDVGEITDPVSCVLLAATARQLLLDAKRGTLIRGRWLAALASVAESRIHQLVAAGELTRINHAIKATQAKVWLASRGVPGF